MTLAAACLRLDREPELRRRVVDEAFELVGRHYERGVVGQRIRELFGP